MSGIVSINCKATLKDLLNNVSTGVVRQFVLADQPKDRLSELVFYAHSKQSARRNVYIEVKYASKYSSREKRIELVTLENGNLCIYKVSALNRFDKDAIELKRLIDEICEEKESNISISGVLIMKSKTDIIKVREMLTTMQLDISVE